MKTPSSNLDALMKSPQGAAVAKHKEEILSLLQSPDAQKLMALLEQGDGDGLKKAADAALKGDASGLMSRMGKVMESKEGAELVGRINRSIPKD